MKYILALTCGLLLSCSSNYYQLYKAVPINGVTAQSKIQFEDNNCRITYDLWDYNGNFEFYFYNKTDKDIKILLRNSFMILNGMANDYFKNRTFTNASSINQGVSVMNPWWYYTYHNTNVVSSHSIAFMEPDIIMVPPNSLRKISEYKKILGNPYEECDFQKYPSKNQIKTLKYDGKNSPYTFSNLITYVSKRDTNRISTGFYISEITNYPESSLFTTKAKVVCGKTSEYERIRVSEKNSPDSFYLKYLKVQ